MLTDCLSPLTSQIISIAAELEPTYSKSDSWAARSQTEMIQCLTMLFSFLREVATTVDIFTTTTSITA